MKKVIVILIVALVPVLGLQGVASAAPVDSWDENDFSAQVFQVDLTRDWNGDNCRWTTDLAGIDGHWSTGFQVMIAEGSSPKFLLGWAPGDSETDPIYKEYNGGWGPPTATLPDGMSVSGAYNQTHYVIQVPASYLGSSFGWAVNVEASWPGHSSSEKQRFPADWVAWTATNTYEDTVPAEGGGCFIATAACGPDDASVDTLRAFRDTHLAGDSVGSGFVSAYYELSPPIADFIDDHPALKPAVRVALSPAVGMSEAAALCLGGKLAIALAVSFASGMVVLRLRKKPSLG